MIRNIGGGFKIPEISQDMFLAIMSKRKSLRYLTGKFYNHQAIIFIIIFLINPFFFSIKKKVKKGSGSKTLPPNSNNSPSRTMESPSMNRKLPADPSEAIGSAVVKYNYQAQQPDELSLTKGTRILILEKSNDGWWRGQSGSQAGWFPSNYTQEEGDGDDGVHTYAMAENVLDIVVALYSFSSNNDQELSFEKGDRLEILDRPPSDPEWYKARNAQGQIGLVPRNYLQVC